MNDVKEFDEKPEDKYKRTKEIIDDALSKQCNIVVFCNANSLNELERGLRDYEPVVSRNNGSPNPHTYDDNLMYRLLGEDNVLIVEHGSEMAGLTAAPVMIEFDRAATDAEQKQISYSIIGAYQERDVSIYRFI